MVNIGILNYNLQANPPGLGLLPQPRIIENEYKLYRTCLIAKVVKNNSRQCIFNSNLETYKTK